MPTTPQERARFRQLDKEQTLYERFWQPRIEAVINAQIKTFTAALRSMGKEYALAHINDLISPIPMNEVLSTLWRIVGTQAANSEWAFFQNTYGEELRNEKRFGFNKIWADIMRRIFSKSGGERIVKITHTEHDRVRQELEQATQDGKVTNYELAEALESSNIGRVRSKVIARTETAYAASAGGEAAARQTGVLMEKTWLSTQDNRTRHLPEDSADHRTMNGVTVPMNDKFVVPSKNGADLMTRPHDLDAPANQTIMCRCKAVYRAVRDAMGRFIRISSTDNIAA
jgi:hypothetical protein